MSPVDIVVAVDSSIHALPGASQ